METNQGTECLFKKKDKGHTYMAQQRVTANTPNRLDTFLWAGFPR